MPTITTERMKQIADDLRRDGAYTSANSVDSITSERDKLKRELITAREERDRYKADSEDLDWLIASGYCPWGSDIDDCKDMPEHLRKRLEGK